MVVWQGITEGGTAVPVQITEEGKVVAIGESGPIGPPGPEGPPGPPGETWPPNPIEGAFLVWLNGEPTWYVDTPIPLPPNLIGPIIDIPSNDSFTVEGKIDEQQFFNGREVVVADKDSVPKLIEVNQAEIWSNGIHECDEPAKRAFDGDLNTFTLRNGSAGTELLWRGSITAQSKIEVYGFQSGYEKPFENKARANGGTWSAAYGPKTWVELPGLSYPVDIFEITIQAQGDGARLSAVRVDGALLVDSDLTPPEGLRGEGQVSGVFNDTVLLSRIQGVISKGDYLLAPPAAMAAWLVTKRGIKVENPSKG